MLTMEEVKNKTSLLFDSNLALPEPSLNWRRKIEVLEAANLLSHRAAAIFDMRCEQAEQLGFQRIMMADMVSLLMGESHTDDKVRSDLKRQSHEWFYNHHTGEILEGSKCNWGGNPHDYIKMDHPNLWYTPPFLKREIWRCRFGKLDYLKRDIPYGVVLRIQEVKEIRLFNVFNVLAPIEAWERKTDIDPVVVATIWELPTTDKGEYENAGQVAHFFLAQW